MFSVALIQHSILLSLWAKRQVAIKQHTMCAGLWITGAFRCFHHAVIIAKNTVLGQAHKKTLQIVGFLVKSIIFKIVRTFLNLRLNYKQLYYQKELSMSIIHWIWAKVELEQYRQLLHYCEDPA